MKKRSFRSTFVSVILVITVAISIVNLAVYGINIKKIRQVEVLKMKTAGERIDDMITISLNNIKGLKQICCTDNYARNILLKNNEKNDIGTKFENQNYMDNALKHIASMDTLILRATVGAGDVFHGAFLAAIVKGLSPKDAARFASGVAAIKCTRIGGRAGIPNWEVTDNFLETGEIDYREIDERVKKYGRGIEYV